MMFIGSKLKGSENFVRIINNKAIMADNLERHIHEGWSVKDYIEDLTPMFRMIMNNQSWMSPFKTKKEIADWCKDTQSYYKKAIPEVNNHFYKLAGL